MSSAFADRFNAVARPALRKLHGEDLHLRMREDGVMVDKTIRCTFKRIDPNGGNLSDSIGEQTYEGSAQIVCDVADLPAPPPAGSFWLRDGVTWQITYVERQDEWTWKHHLSRAEPKIRNPERLR